MAQEIAVDFWHECTLNQKKRQFTISWKRKPFVKTIRQGYCIPNYFEFKGNHAKASDTLVIQYFQYLNTDAKC